MLILPAIDLFEGKAVRLLRGDYSQMTIYDKEPLNTALKFKSCGAEWLHIVDLEGAKSGLTPNFDIIIKIKNETGLKCEVGGGVRNYGVIERYIKSGVDRVILGTAAVMDFKFVESAVKNFDNNIAVGIDVKDGYAAVKGWTESANIKFADFLDKMCELGVKNFICTDISRDGAMKGANIKFYQEILKLNDKINLIASGGVSTLEDVRDLAELNIYGAIIGKALYTGDIELSAALSEALKAGKGAAS